MRGSKLGVKFRRQHVIGRFIVDFYSPEAKLAVEVDGPIHDVQKQYDAERDSELTAKGYYVLRFENRRVLNEIETVVREIASALRPHPRPSGTPSP